MRLSGNAEYADTEWRDNCEKKNRICYVIEVGEGCLYCGECAVKDISADIPEIEIELLQEYQHQGIGYKAIIMMLNEVAKQYGKREFYAKTQFSMKNDIINNSCPFRPFEYFFRMQDKSSFKELKDAYANFTIEKYY